jgi:hypothetical protein
MLGMLDSGNCILELLKTRINVGNEFHPFSQIPKFKKNLSYPKPWGFLPTFSTKETVTPF